MGVVGGESGSVWAASDNAGEPGGVGPPRRSFPRVLGVKIRASRSPRGRSPRVNRRWRKVPTKTSHAGPGVSSPVLFHWTGCAIGSSLAAWPGARRMGPTTGMRRRPGSAADDLVVTPGVGTGRQDRPPISVCCEVSMEKSDFDIKKKVRMKIVESPIEASMKHVENQRVGDPCGRWGGGSLWAEDA